MRFLDMKTDYAFKKVFGSDNSKDILLNFLNPSIEKAYAIANRANLSKEELELQEKKRRLSFYTKKLY